MPSSCLPDAATPAAWIKLIGTRPVRLQVHCETLEQVYPERFAKRYGFWRPHLKEVMVHYWDCGDLHAGFARIRCDACGTERLLAFQRGKRRDMLAMYR